MEYKTGKLTEKELFDLMKEMGASEYQIPPNWAGPHVEHGLQYPVSPPDTENDWIAYFSEGKMVWMKLEDFIYKIGLRDMITKILEEE